jgi:hypothetical protein
MRGLAYVRRLTFDVVTLLPAQKPKNRQVPKGRANALPDGRNQIELTPT